MASATGMNGERPPRRLDAASQVGAVVLAAGLAVWGIGYEMALARRGRRTSLLTGALSAVGGFAVGRLLLPRWVVPNFVRTMGADGTFAKYAALGLAAPLKARR